MTAAVRLPDLADLGDRDNYPWVRGKIARHRTLEGLLCSRYVRDHEAEGLRAANHRLREADELLRVPGTNLSAAADDGEIRDCAEAIARTIDREVSRICTKYDLAAAVEYGRSVTAKNGQEFPLADSQAEDRGQQMAALARISCPRWWRRRIRAEAARRLEQYHRLIGLVSRRRGAYVSNTSLARRQQQHSRNSQLLLGLEAVSDAGDVVNLAECRDASVSNPENRRHELMTRLRGNDELAEAAGLATVFFTLTCPSRFHAVLSGSCELNPKYNGATPREAQDYLCATWASIRADWHRAGIRAYGFRMAEPHHDGCPHWHLVLHMPWDSVAQAVELFGDGAMLDSPGEPGADKHRWDFQTLEPGQATGYLAKYVAKNIDGHQVGDDFEAQAPAAESAKRVEAWAGIWGIRQFQPIGNTSVTVWRELRRMRDSIDSSHGHDWEAIRLAADAGNWAEFVELMGGALVTREGQTLRAWMLEREEAGRYGEAVERLQGLIMRATALHIGITRAQLNTRPKTWEIRAASAASPTGPP